MKVRCLVAFCLLLKVCECRSQIASDGGYTNVLVAISPSLTTNPSSFLPYLQSLLKQSSDFLFTATENTMYLKNINVLVPKKWKNEVKSLKDIELKLVPEGRYDFNAAEIRVDDSNPLHGNRPYTHKTTSCGQYGEYIHITPEYLTSKKIRDKFGEPRNVFVQNWSQLRYGVFSEYGYANDTIYPKLFYTHNETVYPTSCTDVDLEGSFFCSKVNETYSPKILNISNFQNCNFVADNTNDISSSIMFKSIAQITSFCNPSTHRVDAPTKHNFLCEYKDSWDIIQKSDDFRKVEKSSKQELQFSFLLEEEHKNHLAFVIDNSAYMKEYSRYENTVLSIDTLTKILPIKPSFYSLITFDTGADVRSSFQTLFSARRSSTDKPCVGCGISKAIELNATEIILIGGRLDIGTIRSAIMKNNVRLHVILFKMADMTVVGNWIKLAKETRGFLTIVQSKDFSTSVKLILRAFLNTLSSRKLLPGNIDFELFKRLDKKFDGKIEFNPPIPEKGVTLLCSGEATFSMQCKESSVQINSNNFGKELFLDDRYMRYQVDEKLSGTCSYELTPKKDIASCIILVLRKPEMKLLKVESGIYSLDGNVVLVNGGVLLSVKVSLASYEPIIAADVVATVLFQPANESNPKSVEINLHDNGNGDPDLIRDDGIYTAYLTHPVALGVYQPSVKISSSSRTLLNLYDARSSSEECCGSFVPLENTKTMKEFRHDIFFSSVYLDKVIDQDSLNGPARIGDLRCKQIPSPANSKEFFLNLLWTAPGSRLTHGTAVAYEILISVVKEAIINNRSSVNTTTLCHPDGKMFNPQASGMNEMVDIRVSTSGIQYVAVQAKNKLGKVGKISNIVQVNVISSFKNKQQEPSPKTHSTHSIGFILTMVGVGILVILIIILIFYCVEKQTTKKRVKSKASQVEAPDTPHASADKSPETYSVQDTLQQLSPSELEGFFGNCNPSFNSSDISDDPEIKNNSNKESRKSIRRITLV